MTSFSAPVQQSHCFVFNYTTLVNRFTSMFERQATILVLEWDLSVSASHIFCLRNCSLETSSLL